MVDLSISRKLSILTFLQASPRTLGELAHHFARTPANMLKELREIFLVELEQDGFYLSPFDLDLPDNPDPHSMVTLSDFAEIPNPAMTLAEVISVLALVDTLLVATDPDTSAQLSSLRARLVEATTASGYASVLWPAPTRLGSTEVFHTITTAIDKCRYVLINYAKSDTQQAHLEEAEIGPIRIETGRTPRVIAVKNDEIRRYRLDRIASAELTERTLSKRQAKAILNAPHTESEGIRVTLVTDLSARWILESIPVESWAQEGNHLHITLYARPQWLGTLLIRLGTSLVDIVGEDGRNLIAGQYEDLLTAYEEDL